MTIAGKINLMAASALLLGALVLLAATGLSMLAQQRVQLVALAGARVDGAPGLASDIYFGNTAAQQRLLEALAALSPAVRYAFLLSPSGSERLGWPADREQLPDLPELSALRSTVSLLDRELTTRRRPAGDPVGYPWAGIPWLGRLHDFSIPVAASLNPLESGHSAADFAATRQGSAGTTSQYVFGYVIVGVDDALLAVSVAERLWPLALTLLAIVALVIAIIARQTAGIRRALNQLADVADEIVSGRFDSSRQLPDLGELRQLGATFNNMITGLEQHRSKLQVDQQLLRMKVDERTEQLSRRNIELNRAVEEVSQTRDRLRRLAYFDSLTSLPNRRLLTEQLDLLLRSARRNEQIIALLFIDLDNFKRINDSLGHSAGDQLLQEVAERLVLCVRDSDLVSHSMEPDARSRIDVSRLGGDEFTVVLNQIERAESAGVVAKRLIEALVAPIRVEGHEIIITPSIGIAVAPDHGSDVGDLLKAADTAMYQAKTRGKNNYLFYHSDMLAAGMERLKLESDLRQALEREGELMLHYQPQVDCRNGDIIGAEALLRWHHPEQGPIPPNRFIPLAEEIGLIGELGYWTLREACHQLVRFDRAGVKLPKVAVNVSALQFNQALIGQVRQALKDSGLSPERLVLELTEGIAMDDTRDVIKGLYELKKLGVTLSIDDFGTGYSSLNYLSRFPLDDLKIDRSFVTSLEGGGAASGLVSAIIAMANSLNLELVAEGVETAEQHKFLQERGVNIIQGFLFSKPLPAEEFAQLLSPGYYMPQITDLRGHGLRALK